jgi:hypothetical protein
VSTPTSRLAAFTATAQTRGLDLVDAIPNPAYDGRLELRVADLAAVLDALGESCPGHRRCTVCGVWLCRVHGLGSPADCPGGRVHCRSAWCLCVGEGQGDEKEKV